jgi:hypothetical protein
MTHVRTKAPNGDGIVIVPEADYDRMIEELEDLRGSLIARRVLRDIENGEEEMLASAEADELLAAKTPLAFWRRKRDLTQAASPMLPASLRPSCRRSKRDRSRAPPRP